MGGRETGREKEGESGILLVPGLWIPRQSLHHFRIPAYQRSQNLETVPLQLSLI